MRLLIQLTVLALAISPALAGKSKIAKDLEKADKNETVKVVVRLNPDLDKKSLQKVRAKLLNKIKKDGAEKKRDLDLVNGLLITIKAKHLAKLADDFTVEYITPNRMLLPTLEKAVPTTGAAIAHDYGWDGDGIGVVGGDVVETVGDDDGDHAALVRMLDELPEIIAEGRLAHVAADHP